MTRAGHLVVLAADFAKKTQRLRVTSMTCNVHLSRPFFPINGSASSRVTIVSGAGAQPMIS